MQLIDRILFFISKGIIDRNKVFAGIHKGETCYLIGNGASIKYFNLEKFNNHLAIGCNSLFVHSDFQKINVKYYFTGHQFFYYPFWKNPILQRFEKNNLGSIYKDKLKENKNIILFSDLSNYFAMNKENKYFFHHFNQKFDGFDKSDLHGSFSSVADALSGMLGLAIYMGFEKINLVGCDYAFYPKSNGHFFDFGKFPDLYDEKPNNEIIYKSAQAFADIQVVVPNDNYKGHILPSVSYEELTGDKPKYKENYEIITPDNLMRLSEVNLPYVIYEEKNRSS